MDNTGYEENSNLKANPEFGLHKIYLSDETFLVNLNITKAMFKPVVTNKSKKELLKLRDIRKNIESGCAKYNNKLYVKRMYRDDGIAAYTDSLDMNDSFLLFSFFIHKFEQLNREVLRDKFEYEIKTSWNEIIEYLRIPEGDKRKTKNLHKYAVAIERMRYSRLDIGGRTSGLISEYENVWPSTE